MNCLRDDADERFGVYLDDVLGSSYYRRLGRRFRPSQDLQREAQFECDPHQSLFETQVLSATPFGVGVFEDLMLWIRLAFIFAGCSLFPFDLVRDFPRLLVTDSSFQKVSSA